jgi:hypothetical protein
MLLNTKSKVVHRQPTREQYNVDQARRAGHLRRLRAVPAGARRCGYCWSSTEEPRRGG